MEDLLKQVKGSNKDRLCNGEKCFTGRGVSKTIGYQRFPYSETTGRMTHQKCKLQSTILSAVT